MADFFDPSVLVTHLSFAPIFMGVARGVVQTNFLLPENISAGFKEIERSQATEEISQFSDYAEDWDGYGAASFKRKTIENATAAIERLLRVSRLPDITPNPNATISFEWEGKGGFAHLEIGESKYSFFISMSTGEKYFLDGDAGDINEQIGILLEMVLFPAYVPTQKMNNALVLQAA